MSVKRDSMKSVWLLCLVVICRQPVCDMPYISLWMAAFFQDKRLSSVTDFRTGKLCVPAHVLGGGGSAEIEILR